MPRLVIDLNRYRNVLYGCVRHLDEHLRNNGDLVHGETEEYRYDIKSSSMPDIDDDGTTLYVWGGNEDGDHKAFSYSYASVERAVEAEKMFNSLVREFNEQVSCEESSVIDEHADMPF